jgi:hypothetical protein
MTKTQRIKATTIDKVKPGTIVHLLSRGIDGTIGYRYDGKTVRVQGPTEANHEGGLNRFYAWQAYRQGKTIIHGSVLCEECTTPELCEHRF